MKRVFKSTGKPQFKGSGFYETDYKDKSKWQYLIG
jgi:predicted nucleic acid-binding Zn ribbon protein